MEETKKKRIVIVIADRWRRIIYDIPFGSRIKGSNGDIIEAGDEITEGSVNPHDIMRIKGVNGVKNISSYQKFKRFIDYRVLISMIST